MKLYILTIASCIFSMPLLNSCSSDEPVITTSEGINTEFQQIEMTPNDIEAADNQLAFALDFLGGVAKCQIQTGDFSNYSVSPVSLAANLSMLANVVGENDRQPIIRTLGFDDIDGLNTYYGKLLSYLPVYNDTMGLILANNIWYTNKYGTPSAQVLSEISKYYQTTPQAVDFSNKKTPGIISSWVEQKTMGKIKDLVKSCSSNTIMMLANAMYFKGKWVYPFSELSTKDETFKSREGDIMVPMMRQDVYCEYRQLNGIKLIQFGLCDGHTSMYFILPPENEDIYSFIASFDKKAYDDLMNNGYTGKNGMSSVIIHLPKFKIDYELNTSDYLKMCGIDLKNVDITPLQLKNVTKAPAEMQQVTQIEVNEKGVEAAAVTITGIFGAGPNEPRQFFADRPFAYLLIEEATNTVLMAGVVENPLK